MCECNDCGSMPKEVKGFKKYFQLFHYKFKVRKFKTVWKLKFALGFLNWLYKADDSAFVHYFENEWELSHKNVIDEEKKFYNNKRLSYRLLLSLCDLFDHTTGVSKYLLNKVFEFRPLSPLSLGDDEFYSVTDAGTSQNYRRSSIFRDENGNIYDIDAIGWVTDKRLDIAEDGKEHKLELFPLNRSSHHGCVIAYDFKNEKWIPLSSSQKIIPNNDYEANHYFEVKCIELYDSTDEHNDFFTYIADIEDIPEEFYHYFILDDCRNYRNVEFDEEIEYLEKHQMQNLLIKSDSYNLNDFVTSCSEDDNTLKANILYCSKRYAMLLMRELNNNGVSYNDMKYKSLDDCIYISNYSANKENIEKVFKIKLNTNNND